MKPKHCSTYKKHYSTNNKCCLTCRLLYTDCFIGKFLAFIVCLSVTVGAWGNVSEPIPTNRVIKLATEAEVYKKPVPPTVQLCAEVASLVIQQLGLRYEVVPVPLKNMKKVITKGEVDGSLCQIDDYSKYMKDLRKIPTPIAVMEIASFVPAPRDKDDRKVIRKSSRKRINNQNWMLHRVGVLEGVVLTHKMAKTLPYSQVQKSPKQLFDSLLNKRLDLLLLPRFDGLNWLYQYRMKEKIHVLNPSVERKNLYMFFHRRHQALADQVEYVLKDMENTGILTELRLKVATKVRR